MRAAIIAAVFVTGFISGQITQAQPKEAPSLPAERVSGIRERRNLFVVAVPFVGLGQCRPVIGCN